MSKMIPFDNDTNNHSCLIFSLEEKLYGIDVDNVLEVIKLPKLDIPQKMPKHIIGILTYNNISVKVVDLYSILSHQAKKCTIDSQIILVKTEEAIFGLLIDKTIDVKAVKTTDIQPLPYYSENNLVQYLYKMDTSFVSILDLNSIQTVMQKTQFEINDKDTSKALPTEENEKAILEKRQYDLIKKFNTSIQQIYYDQEQYIIFALNNNLYALPIKNVKEIAKYKNITTVSLPTTYDYIKGIFNHRGEFITILDFKKFINLASDPTPGTEQMIIVLELMDFRIALLTDEIIDIVTVTPNEIVTKFDNKLDSKYINSELHIKNNIISVISIDKLLSDERLYIKD